MADCVVCGREMADQAYACRRCAAPVERELEQLARLAPELDVTIARQGRTGEGGRGGDDEPLPFDPQAAQSAWVVVNTVTTWIRDVARSRGVRALRYPRTPGPTCRTNAGVPACGHASCLVVARSGQPVDGLAEAIRWLSRQVEWLRHQPEAAQAFDELGDACAVAVRTVDRKTPQWYAGPCGAILAPDLAAGGEPGDEIPTRTCGEDLYAYPGAVTVRCRCGAQHDAQDRRTWLLREARDTLVHAELLARAVTALGVRGVDDRPVTPAMVRGMAHRGRLEVRGHDQAGRPLYRVGDVLNAVDEQRVAAARRADTKPGRRKVEGSAA